MKPLSSKTSTENKLQEAFRALGDPTRYKLMQLLIQQEGICVSELADEVDISIAGVSQQLKILEQSGLIKRIRAGQKICYQSNPSDPIYKQIKPLLS